MPRHETPSRTDRMVALLTQVGRAMTLEELSAGLNIPPAKLRTTLTNFDSRVVRVGTKLFDLGDRVYVDRTFRYTPSAPEIKLGAIEHRQDIYYLLQGFNGFWNDIHLVDGGGRTATLTRDKKARIYARGLLPLLKHHQTDLGDDWLFTCQDLPSHTYLFRVQPRQERHEKAIQANNKKLADLIYSSLLYAIKHSDTDMWLIRKYAYLFDRFTDDAPDNLVRILAHDIRFIYSYRDSICGWSGEPLTDRDILTVGLRKYYDLASDNTYVEVSVQTDEWGDKVGWCTRCDSFLLWDKLTGWRHPTDEMERVDAGLPKDFFTAI